MVFSSEFPELPIAHKASSLPSKRRPRKTDRSDGHSPEYPGEPQTVVNSSSPDSNTLEMPKSTMVRGELASGVLKSLQVVVGRGGGGSSLFGLRSPAVNPK